MFTKKWTTFLSITLLILTTHLVCIKNKYYELVNCFVIIMFPYKYIPLLLIEFLTLIIVVFFFILWVKGLNFFGDVVRVTTVRCAGIDPNKEATKEPLNKPTLHRVPASFNLVGMDDSSKPITNNTDSLCKSNVSRVVTVAQGIDRSNSDVVKNNDRLNNLLLREDKVSSCSDSLHKSDSLKSVRRSEEITITNKLNRGKTHGNISPSIRADSIDFTHSLD